MFIRIIKLYVQKFVLELRMVKLDKALEKAIKQRDRNKIQNLIVKTGKSAHTVSDNINWLRRRK